MARKRRMNQTEKQRRRDRRRRRTSTDVLKAVANRHGMKELEISSGRAT